MNTVEASRTRLTGWLERAGHTVDAVVETHLSILAFTPSSVFKMKKPVRYPFCDLSTPALRAADAAQEVALNARLAPDVYRGVVEVTDERDAVVDTAVEMRRLDDRLRLSSIADRGHGTQCVRAVAQVLGAFHDRALRSGDAAVAASRDGVAALWRAGFDQSRRFRGDPLDGASMDRIEFLAERFLAGRATVFARRVAAGRAVDGHGDLLADDVFCEPSGPQIIDCLEFDRSLRVGDTLLDIAFLAMDLEAGGRPDLATLFLDEYRRATGDVWPPALEDHYIAYRAHVRAKVACLRYEQGDAAAAALAGDRLRLCLDHLELGRVRLVLVGGLPGTGKSTIARELGRRRNATVLRTDDLRGPGAAASSFGEGMYADSVKDTVYRRLLDEAATLLAGGESVILDATWNGAARRAAAVATALEHAADLVEIVCCAPAPLCRHRLLVRGVQSTDPSHATPAVHDAMRAAFDDWPAAVAIDTMRSIDESVVYAVQAFDT